MKHTKMKLTGKEILEAVLPGLIVFLLALGPLKLSLSEAASCSDDDQCALVQGCCGLEAVSKDEPAKLKAVTGCSKVKCIAPHCMSSQAKCVDHQCKAVCE